MVFTLSPHCGSQNAETSAAPHRTIFGKLVIYESAASVNPGWNAIIGAVRHRWSVQRYTS